MSQEILYILLPDFASHEMAYLMEAISSDEQQLKPNPRYVNKIVASTMEQVTAIGGLESALTIHSRICPTITPPSY